MKPASFFKISFFTFEPTIDQIRDSECSSCGESSYQDIIGNKPFRIIYSRYGAFSYNPNGPLEKYPLDRIEYEEAFGFVDEEENYYEMKKVKLEDYPISQDNLIRKQKNQTQPGK
jgi:hypothetical protein